MEVALLAKINIQLGWVQVVGCFKNTLKDEQKMIISKFTYNVGLLIQMKKILNIVEEYLRKYPSPSSITRIGDLFKLTYTYSTPYTDSKQAKDVFLPFKNISSHSLLQNTTKKLNYNEKGRIQQSDSFDSVLVKQKHEKLLQDSCFGQAQHTKDYSKWVYTAEVKQDPVKSLFNEGKGKQPFVFDFGQGYEGVKQAGIFLWDKATKKVYRVEIEKNLIPAHVSFANEEGSEIIFHAYKRQNFGHGILHCLNRPVSIYHAKLKLVTKESQKKESENKNGKPELKIEAEVTQVIKDHHQTNMFPRLSPCFNYLIYISGTGITHTFYLDLVVAQKKDGSWTETHRLKERVIGYYNTLQNYIVQKEGKTYAYFQTMSQSVATVERLDLDTGEIKNLTSEFKDTDFSIDDIEDSGFMTGSVTTNNFNTFFYSMDDQIVLIDPPQRENFITKTYQLPIPAALIYANQEDIDEEYRHRAAQRPMVMLLHGGPHGSYAHALTCMRYTLLKMGYAILMPNFPGSVGYGPEYINKLLKGIGQHDAEPILDLLKTVLAENQTFDKTRVHLYGGSYGGYLSALFGSRHSSLFKSAIILNGVLSNSGELWFTDIPEWVIAQTLGKNQMHSLTQQDYVEMWRQSSARQPMKIPTLQFLGAKDLRVPYRQGLYFDAITKDVGTPITTYVYENSNHNLADSVETSMDIIVKTLMFLEEVKEEEKQK